MNDQGLIFFLPNATWLQPPAWAHAMITQTWQPQALPIEVTIAADKQQSLAEHAEAPPTIPAGTVAGTVSVSAQANDNRSTVALRVTNFGVHPATVAVSIKPAKGASFALEDAAVKCWQLSSAKLTDANTPGQPDKIVPQALGAVSLSPLLVPAFSFTACEVASAAQ